MEDARLTDRARQAAPEHWEAIVKAIKDHVEGAPNPILPDDRTYVLGAITAKLGMDVTGAYHNDEDAKRALFAYIRDRQVTWSTLYKQESDPDQDIRIKSLSAIADYLEEVRETTYTSSSLNDALNSPEREIMRMVKEGKIPSTALEDSALQLEMNKAIKAELFRQLQYSRMNSDKKDQIRSSHDEGEKEGEGAKLPSRAAPRAADVLRELSLELERQAKEGPSKKQRFKEIDLNLVIDNTMAGFTNEGLDVSAWEFEGESGYAFIRTFLEHVRDQEYKTIEFAYEFERTENDFATVSNLIQDTGKNQFNAWVFDKKGKKWLPNAAKTILGDMQNLKESLGEEAINHFAYKTTEGMAMETASLIASTYAQQIDLESAEWRNHRRVSWYLPDGLLFDFEHSKEDDNILDSSIREIDPSRDFSKEIDSHTPYEKEGVTAEMLKEKEKLYCEMMTERFGSKEKFQMYDDYCATIVIPAGLLGFNPKMLMLLGDINRFKSALVQLPKWVYGETKCGKIKVDKLLKDTFGDARTANMAYVYMEEMSPKLFADPAALADRITEDMTTPRIMHSTKTRHSYRQPRYAVAGNQIASMGESVKLTPLYKRLLPLEVVETSDNTLNPYDLLEKDEVMLMAIQRRWLLRAKQILKDASCVHTMDEDGNEAREVIDDITHRDMMRFFEGAALEGDQAMDIGVDIAEARAVFELPQYADMKINARDWAEKLTRRGIKVSKTRCIDAGLIEIEGRMLTTYHKDKNIKQNTDAEGNYQGEYKRLLLGYKWANTILEDAEDTKTAFKSTLKEF